jgi:sec-independent protein translocase protein TatC
MVAIALGFAVCYYFAGDVFNILIVPYQQAVGSDEVTLIYTAPQEAFVTRIKLALWGGVFLAFPIVSVQLWMFVAPGLYKNEQNAFLPFLAATPVLFILGAMLCYYLILPLAFAFLLQFEQAGAAGMAEIQSLPKVSQYLGFIMALVLAFGVSFQLPVLLTLLGRVGIVTSDMLRSGRKYAVVGIFAAAAILTPPDLVSQLGLGIPTMGLYEISIWLVAMIEKRRQAEESQTQS